MIQIKFSPKEPVIKYEFYFQIIITDGIFQDKLAAYQYAKVARDQDIKIFGIGVGNKDRFRQLNEVSGGAENVFYHDDFSNLLQKISELKVVQFECFDEFKDFCKGKRH